MKHYVIFYVYFIWFAGRNLSLGLFDTQNIFSIIVSSVSNCEQHLVAKQLIMQRIWSLVFYNIAANNKMVYIHPSQYVNKKLYWNRSVHRDREVMANMADIIIKKQKEERYKLIDVVTPAERNVTPDEAAKKKITRIYL